MMVWGVTANVELMPTDFFSVRVEVNWRHSTVPFFSGPEGVTSSSGFIPTNASFVRSTRRDQTLLVVAANFRL